jgi:hypothetical protein
MSSAEEANQPWWMAKWSREIQQVVAERRQPAVAAMMRLPWLQ